MSGRRYTPVLLATGAAAVLVLTTACSGSSGSDSGAAPAAGTSAVGGSSISASSAPTTPGVIGQALPEDIAAENSIAACMKRQGFTYIPHALLYDSDDSGRMQFTGPNSLLRSDTELRAWRQKYGFGQASAQLYPHDPQVAMASTVPNPNEPIVKALDPARRAAYNKALTGSAVDPRQMRAVKGSGSVAKIDPNNCMDKAEKVSDKAAKKERQESEAVTAEAKKQMARFVNAPDAQHAVNKYLRCLGRIGLKPQSSSTAFIANAASDAFAETHPDPSELSPSETRTQLTKEIKAALADMTCRAPLAKLVQTKYPDEPSAAMHGGSDGVG